MPFDSIRESESDLLDRLAREAYAEDGRHGAAIRLARKHGVDVRRIYYHARRLCLSRRTKSSWTDQENELIESNDHMTNCQLQKLLKKHGFGRGVPSINSQRKLLSATLANSTNCYSASALAELMGIDATTVQRWAQQGLIKAERREGSGKQRDPWIIRREHVRRFLIDHPLRWRLAGVDQLWLIDILARRGGGGQS